jgi:hypothetical protein
MKQPKGLLFRKEDLICKLQKSHYGLKQSPRQWYKRFDTFMLSQSFKRFDYDGSRGVSDGIPEHHEELQNGRKLIFTVLEKFGFFGIILGIF